MFVRLYATLIAFGSTTIAFLDLVFGACRQADIYLIPHGSDLMIEARTKYFPHGPPMRKATAIALLLVRKKGPERR